ncbi:alpha/beta-hydrolase [Decorospora gaudefroyi]|uniref:Alpha/beta-hydrolase n=1 Tax=Decorospora gaudefroyi TaxID=184978 RepID=A0A6A5K9I2_9PLEO|nr:alpha/beta-hydrolase [Decorospora gaudefroyi]
MFSLFASEKPQPKAAEVAIKRISSISATQLSRFERLPKLQRYAIIGAASVGGLSLLWTLTASSRSARRPPVPSPRQSLLPGLSPEDAGELPYHPAALPGARDVDSPFGTIRVYEFGPRDGEKVLLIHGISTPSIALTDLAHKLVGRGRRVMLFDLFGRGYSDAPSPDTTHYDSSLYITQILLCLQSSPIHWSSFTMVGYSLGGAIAADFTSYFPNLVRGLVLVAPGGLIRKKHIAISSKMLYQSSWMPEWMVSKLVANRLWTGAKRVETAPDAVENAETTTTASEGNAKYLSSNQMLLPGNPHSTVSSVVDWQIKNHRGFVPAFISTIRHAPIHNQHHRWSVIRENIESRAGPLKEVWIVLGETDPIILADELTEDAKAVLGEDNVRIKVLEGAGHEVAIERADDIVRVVRRIDGKGESSSSKEKESEPSSSKKSSRRKHGGSHAGSSTR